MVASITLLTLEVLNQSQRILSHKLNPGAPAFPFSLNENHTLALYLKSNFSSSPKHAIMAIESGVYSVTYPFVFKDRILSIVLAPPKLRKLHKHSGKYNLRIVVSDSLMAQPVIWHAGIVGYEANGEVVDNFTDVEWDFTPPPKTPNPMLTEVFTWLTLVPFVILLVLLLVNGVNCGYFPRGFVDAIFSLAFVAALGAFFAFFLYFWKYLTFEDMCKCLLGIAPVLGILLRGALGARAKMVAKDAKSS
jgi:hypothetical protein